MSAVAAPFENGRELPLALLSLVRELVGSGDLVQLQNRYLDTVEQFVPGFAAGIYVLDPFTRGVQSVAARGVSDFFLSRYEEAGRREDPVLAEAFRTTAAVDNRQLMSEHEWMQLPVYAGVFKLHKMTRLLEVPVCAAGKVVGTLNFGRNSLDGAFVPADRAVAEALAGLVGVALATIQARSELEREHEQVVAALELCSEAVVVTDLAGATRRTNAAAERLMEKLAEEDVLDELMAVPVRDAEVRRHEAPVHLRDGSKALLTARTTRAGQDANVMVSFLELISATGDGTSGLAQLGLTPRQQQVAFLAANGLHDDEIAEQLFLSQYTVKQYLKAVYAKIGARSRVDLARLAAACAACPSPESPTPTHSGTSRRPE